MIRRLFLGRVSALFSSALAFATGRLKDRFSRVTTPTQALYPDGPRRSYGSGMKSEWHQGFGRIPAGNQEMAIFDFFRDKIAPVAEGFMRACVSIHIDPPGKDGMCDVHYDITDVNLNYKPYALSKKEIYSFFEDALQKEALQKEHERTDDGTTKKDNLGERTIEWWDKGDDGS